MVRYLEHQVEQESVVQYIEDVNSSPPTGTLLLADIYHLTFGATLGFDVGERITLPDSTGATINNVLVPELDLFSGKNFPFLRRCRSYRKNI